MFLPVREETPICSVTRTLKWHLVLPETCNKQLLIFYNSFSFDILSLKVNLELNLFLIPKFIFKLTQGRIAVIVFSKVALAESDSLPE